MIEKYKRILNKFNNQKMKKILSMRKVNEMSNELKNDIVFISIDVTYKCNLKCLHCYNYSGEHELCENELSDSELLQLAEDIAEIKPTVVCLCGGEPLLRVDVLYRMIDIIKSKTKEQTSVNLVTNGMLMTEKIAERLKRAGIDNIQVSLDGLERSHTWLRQNANSYERAIGALTILKKFDIYTSVSCLPSKKNIGEYRILIDICRKYNVRSFRSQPLMLLGRAKDNMHNFKLSDEEYYEIKNIFDELKYDEKYESMDFEWGDPIEHLIIPDDYNMKGILSIDAYGYIQTSPYIPISIGNIRKHSLFEYIVSNYEKYITTNIIREVYNMVSGVENMDVSVNSILPEKYKEGSLYIDIIDEFDKLNLSLNEII